MLSSHCGSDDVVKVAEVVETVPPLLSFSEGVTFRIESNGINSSTSGSSLYSQSLDEVSLAAELVQPTLDEVSLAAEPPKIIAASSIVGSHVELVAQKSGLNPKQMLLEPIRDHRFFNKIST